MEINSENFAQTLKNHGLELKRGKTRALQVNVGFLCNQVCRHCHLNAGPDRYENMNSDTVNDVIAYSGRSGFDVIDITGGAPELNPNIFSLVENLSPLASRLIFRSNLSILNDGKRDDLIELLKAKKVNIIASFPSINEAQSDSQRGKGIFRKSIEAVKKLNSIGYGHHGAGLKLDLVSNPTGAFLPASQNQAEKRFREVLINKWGIRFDNLFTFANVPLGRFREWLVETGNFESYISRLKAGFNPCAVEGLMCRMMVSVSWDGYLYDCDFNLACGVPMRKRRTHVSEMPGPPAEGTPVNVADHCYTCTAGAGFT